MAICIRCGKEFEPGLDDMIDLATEIIDNSDDPDDEDEIDVCVELARILYERNNECVCSECLIEEYNNDYY